MKCPVCQCETGEPHIKCPECANVFDRGAVEEYGHLDYLLAWLNEQSGSLEPAVRQQLGAKAEKRLEEVGQLLHIEELTAPPEPVVTIPEPVLRDCARELALLEATLLELADWRSSGDIGDRYLEIITKPVRSRIAELDRAIGESKVQVAPPSKLDTLRHLSDQLPAWAEEGWLPNRPTQILMNIAQKRQAMFLRAQEEPASVAEPVPLAQPAPPAAAKPAPLPAVKPSRAIPVRRVEPKPKAPPKPREPLIDWSKVRQKVSDAAASGMLQNVFLYLGAFMIVISAAILVIRFWESFPQILQLAVIAAVPATFYLLGWLGRARLKLPQAGRVLSYIGALLVAVDFAAIYQFGGLSEQVDLSLYWFVASVVCTVIYALTAWRLATEFAGYITCLGLASTLAALSAWIGLPAEWQVASAALSALAMLAISKRLEQASQRWVGLALAGQRFPILLFPVAQIAILFVPGRLAWGQMTTFALASIGYGALGWLYSFRPRWRAVFTHAAVWSSLGAIIFVVMAIRLPVKWYATAAAMVAPLYIVAGQQLGRRLPKEFSRRKPCLAAFYCAGFGLLSLAVLVSFGMLIDVLLGLSTDIWAAVAALLVATVVLVICSALFQNPWFLLAGSGLFIVPFSSAITRWMSVGDLQQWAPWLMTTWSTLAILYMALARFLPLEPRFGMALNFWSQGLLPSAAIGLIISYAITSASWFAGPTLIALAGIMIVYVLSALIHDGTGHPSLSRLVAWLPEPLRSAIFLWPVGLLAPVWVAVAWLGYGLPLAWLGSILAGLALVYVGLGQFIYVRRPFYRLPLHVYAYALPVTGVGLALGHSWPLLLTLLLSVAVLVALAFIYRRVAEVAGAALLFVWPFHLALTMSPFAPHVYALAYVLLASLVYVPLGQALHPKDSRIPWQADPDTWPKATRIPHAMVLYIFGHLLAAGAVVLSLAGRFDFFEIDLPWIGVVVPAIVCGLLLFSQYRFRGRPFAWAAVLMLVVAYGQALTWLRVPGIYDPIAWVSLAIACMLVERGLSRWAGTSWTSALRRPLWAGAIALCALGVLLTASDTLAAFSGRHLEQYGPTILAQSLAVILTALAARLYRSRWPLYLEPLLIFFPVTLSFAGFGPRIFGQPLATEQYSYVWIGLAVLHLIPAAILDPLRVRYAHGLYLGGYIITALALGWSAPDRLVNTIVLGLALLIAAGSQVTVHFGRHRTYDDLLALLRFQSGSTIWRAARSFFLFIVVYGFPVWLAQLLTHHQVTLAWRGFAFALVAPVYIGLGLLLGRVKAEYNWPLYSAGYALTGIGAMIAIDNQGLFITVLSLNAVVYTASAYIFRQPYWLYLSTTLVPVIALLILDYNKQLAPAWIAGIFMALAYAYVAIGWLLNKRLASGKNLAPFALPFFTLGYLISAIALAVGCGERMLAIGVFSAGVLLYGISAWLFREAIFVYPAAWLAAVPYYLLMALTPLPEAWYGVGLLPLVLAYIGIGRFVFRGFDFGMKNWPMVRSALGRPAMPLYLLAYAFSVWAVVSSLENAVTLTVAMVAVSIIYYGTAALFRSFIWLYPGLLTSHLAILAYVGIDPGDGALQYLSIPFMVLTWLLAIFGLAFIRRFPAGRSVEFRPRQFKIGRWELTAGGWPSVRHLLSPSWSQPFFIFALLDVVVWQVVALGGFDTALLLACSNVLLFGALATLWQDTALAYGAMAFVVLAVGVGFAWAGITAHDSLALMGAAGIVLYGLARMVELARRPLPRFALWIKPLERVSVPLSIVAVVGTLPHVAVHGQATASALGFAGTLYLAIAYRGRYQQLGYLAVAMLELAWILLLIGQDISQPQFYAIPIGLYFAGIGLLERRRGNIRYANILEGFGLAAILLTTLYQSVAATGGFLYFVLLLLESLLIAAWGVIRNVKVPFFTGLFFTLVNIITQLVLVATVDEVWRWIIVLGTGVLVVSLGIFIERKREQIASHIHEWQVELSTWS